jgi:DNA adenine methylase
MQYLGGKSRIAKELVRVMLSSTSERGTYVEPFVGAGSVAAGMVPHFRTACLNDASPDLITLWQALQQGWQPPETVSEDEYRAQRNAPVSALRGFVGYGCSFGGKWFGGYANSIKNHGKYAHFAHNSLLKKLESIRGAEFTNLDYRDLFIPHRSVVYCDPPYRDATKYTRLEDFDSDQFWKFAEDWSKCATVFVSEYSAPEGWRSVWSATPKMTLKRGDNVSTATEHLWIKG